MIEYILNSNPDDRILKRAIDSLNSGEIIVIPTDTNWVFVGDPYQKKAVEKLYRIKGVDSDHHFSLLLDSISRATEVAEISDSAFRLIRNKVPGNYTFIFNATKKMRKFLKASKRDQQVGLRFVPVIFIQKLLEFYKGPLISTNIREEMFPNKTSLKEIYSFEIEEVLGHEVSMIIDPGDSVIKGPSTIYDLRNDEFQLIREGVGSDFL